MRSWRRLGVVVALAAASCAGSGVRSGRVVLLPDPEPVPARGSGRSAASVQSFDAGPLASVTLGSVGPEQTSPNGVGTWALVVGVDRAAGTPPLRYAESDAAEVDAALRAYRVPDRQTRLLTGGRATAGAVREGLSWLVASAGPDAVVVLSFAGHARQRAGGREAFVASDGEEISDGELAERLAPLRAARVVILVATCYAAGFDDVLAPGRLLVAASAENGLAYESFAYGYSYLVEWVVRRAMLGGGAPGSVQDSVRWAQRQLALVAPDRELVVIDRSLGPIVLGPAPPSIPMASPDPRRAAAGSTGPSATPTTGAAPPRTGPARICVAGACPVGFDG